VSPVPPIPGVLQGACRWIISALYEPLMASATELSWLSPLLTIDGSIPALARRSLQRLTPLENGMCSPQVES